MKVLLKTIPVLVLMLLAPGAVVSGAEEKTTPPSSSSAAGETTKPTEKAKLERVPVDELTLVKIRNTMLQLKALEAQAQLIQIQGPLVTQEQQRLLREAAQKAGVDLAEYQLDLEQGAWFRVSELRGKK